MKISRADVCQRLLPIVLSQAFGLVCGIVGVRLTSHLVDPADYGRYGIFTSLIPIGSGVIYIGLVKFLNRHWRDAADRPGLLWEVLGATIRKAPWLVAASVLGTLIAAPGHPWFFGSLLLTSAYLLSLTQLAQVALQAAREHWRDLGIAASVSATRSLLPPLLYSFSGAGFRALLVGFFSHTLLGTLVGGWSLRRWWRQAPAQPRIRSLTPNYDGPRFVLLALVNWTLLGLNRWLVVWFFGAETAGYFTLAGNIGLILPAMLGLIMQQFRQPVWFEAGHASLAQRKALLRDVDLTALLYTGLALGMTGALQTAMPLLVGPVVNASYLPAIVFVLATGFSTMSITIGAFYHTLLLAAKRERDCSAADLSGAACLIAGGFISAWSGLEWLKGWLVVSPVVPWLVNRTVARRALFKSV